MLYGVPLHNPSYLSSCLNAQEQETSDDNSTRHDAEDDLGLEATLHHGVLSSIFGHRPDIIRESADQGCQSQKPEDDTEGHGYFLFHRRRLVLEMKVDEDGNGYNSKIDA